MRKVLNLFGDQSEEEFHSIPTTAFFGNEVQEIAGPRLSTHAFDSFVAFDAAGTDHFSPAMQDSGSPANGTPVNPGYPAAGDSPVAHGEITVIDAAFDAKGGTPGGPGGGGGGGGDPGVLTNYFSGSGNEAAGYDIWIEFKGSGWTVGLQTAFIDAANYFTTVITDDIGGDATYRRKFIDDLYVTAEVKAIDGEGGVLGQAGPTAVWSATELTAAGQMQFDVADALNYFGLGLWDDIVTHELMHVLGFGSLWNYGADPLVVSTGQYTGAAGLAAYNEVFGPGALYIPVETDGGSGTAGAHWDDATLGNELMTGYINNDGNSTNTTDNYLLKFSVMSLADLGYHVTYTDYIYDGILTV